MPLKFEPGRYRSYIRVLYDGTGSSKSIRIALHDLFVGLKLAQDDVQSRHRSIAIDIGDGSGWATSLDEDFEPDNRENTAFWRAAASCHEAHPMINVLLNRALGLYRKLGASKSTGINENDDWQLCEVSLSVLAISSPAFVNRYTKFFAEVWVNDSTPTQAEVIDSIINAHGITEDTEVLILVASLVWLHFELVGKFYPLLEQKYGSVAKSDFFRRIVSQRYKVDRYYFDQLPPRSATLGPREKFSVDYFDGADGWYGNPQLAKAAKRIVEELEAREK